MFILLWSRGRFLGWNMLSLLELGAGRQPRHLDDARVAHIALRTKGVAHRAGHNLELVLVLVRKRHQHDEEAHEQAHEVREGHEPAVAAAMPSPLLPRHGAINSSGPSRRRRSS